MKAQGLGWDSKRPAQWQQTIHPSQTLGPGKLLTLGIGIRELDTIYQIDRVVGGA